jgi:sarcosine oxidase subunit alpha
VTARRLAHGGIIERSQPLSFRFDGMELSGFAGDTVASALMANDVALVGRSFKLHRPRGFFGAGHEDGVMVSRLDPRPATNQLATVTPLEKDATYVSVSTWPNARHDIGAAAQWFSRLLPAGLRLPPRDIDDVVAQLLIERYCGVTLQRSNQEVLRQWPLAVAGG